MSVEFSAETLPTRFDYKTAQQRLSEMWEQKGYFHSEPDSTREPFTIVIPPPNVTGALHLGHALNNTLQDVLIRYKRMRGFNALWMPGTDHAGIATQAVVERRLFEEEGKTRHDLGRKQLVERIWQWKDAYETRILSQLKQMGCSCDWQRTRFTLDETCARAVRQTFFDLFQKRLIYRGKRLVNWDTFLQTAVSDDEVFHETVKGHFWHFQYPVLNPQPGEPEFVTIATTRPETMLGDTAVAVHPDPAAALDAVEKELQERLLTAPGKDKEGIAAELEQVQQRRVEMLPQLIQLRDMAVAGRMLQLPLVNREIPLITDEWAKPHLGSGCVKITPAHDANDYEVGKRADLPMINILNPEGTLNSNAGPYQGDKIQKARKRVIADLDELGLLGEIEDRQIDLAHSDRSKTPIEPYLADQWFVKMNQLAQSAMDAVTDDRVQIFPPRYRKGYLDWLSEKRDWPVSRQLWWGHRIPIWSFTAENDANVWAKQSFDFLETVDITQESQAIASDYEGKLTAIIGPGAAENQLSLLVCVAADEPEIEQQLESSGLTKEDDVLDTWFSSALWPHSTLGWPTSSEQLNYYYPTSTLITSRDIITLWVARMVLAGLNNMGEIPFREVFIHPKILDGYGETMSKSKGNGVDPLDVIEKFGADALRFGIAYLTTDTQDVRMPVQFECPHCQSLMDQTKKNRELPRVQCKKCQEEFSTQWARKEEDQVLLRGAVVSERFELARNFCNKLWNVARLTLINLDGYGSSPVSDGDLAFEDRWILSRLATVTEQVTEGLEHYHYADAARTLYDFAWDEFCSFYAEMAKPRFEDPATRPTAQRVIAYVLDSLLRLLHPMIPFLTEEVWGLLNRVAPVRGLSEPTLACEHVVVAPWPTVERARQDKQLEGQFAKFQAVLGAIREIRSRQGIPPRDKVEFVVRCGAEDNGLLQPMERYFERMANAHATGWGEKAEIPQTHAKVDLNEMDVFVDLKDFIDVEAEIERNAKQESKLLGMISGKEKKLSNESFVQRAPAEVVQREQEGLETLKQQLASVREALEKLRSSS
ncbi:MAG: valine--tRNA ligase [Pirellulaceae bacterium]|nr:valine--tRNA ligase [Pirellulaceae bacterium]